jgi:hypothetical protein
MIDAAGMATTAVVSWLAFEAFMALPADTGTSPWSRFAGSGQVEPRSAGAMAMGARSDKRPESMPPLGQFDFGVSESNAPGEDLSGIPLEAEPEPEAHYDSLRELEAAFDAKYRPPPACTSWSSAAQMANCGNHRIRSRQAFIASGGKTLPGITDFQAPRTEGIGNSQASSGIDARAFDTWTTAPQAPAEGSDDGRREAGAGDYWEDPWPQGLPQGDSLPTVRRQSPENRNGTQFSDPQDWRRTWLQREDNPDADWRQEWLRNGTED